MSNTKDINLADLLLDEENPRLPTTVGRKQAQMVQYIARTTSITEIMTAIAENDYFPGEPLVVLPGPGGKFIVVEGNRRLTALMLLQDPSLYPKSRKIREIAETAEFKPVVIPCVEFKDRDDVVNYLGYRHITGVKQWEPLAKARYIAGYFDHHTDKSTDCSERYSEVARGIGSHGPYIKRQLDGLAIYNFIEQNEFFGIEGLDEENVSFSLLSTAVGYESFLDFVSRSSDPYVKPKKIVEDNVEFLARWMFEQDENGNTILGDSRNIQRLAVILESEEARDALKTGATLDRAYGLTRGVSDDFTTMLSHVEALVTKAVSIVALIDLDELHRTKIQTIFKQARFLKSKAEDD